MSELSKITKLKKLYDYGSHMTPTKWAKAVEILCDGSNETDSTIIDITHSELYALRYNSKLIPGQKYRITDYSRKYIDECIYDSEIDFGDTNPISTRTWFINPHGDLSDEITLFDVIVTANDNDSLDECATLSLKNPDQKIAIVTDETGEKIIYFHQDDEYIPVDENISESLTATDGVIDNEDDLIVEYKYLKDWIQVNKWTCKYNLDNYINDNSYEFAVSDWNETSTVNITCCIQNGIFYIKGITETDESDYFFAKFKIKDANQDIIIISDGFMQIKLNFTLDDCISSEFNSSLYSDINHLLNEGFRYGNIMGQLNSRVHNGTGYIYNMIDQWGNESDFDHSGNTYIKILEGNVSNTKYITNWTTGPLYSGMFDGSIFVVDKYPIILNGSKDSNISLGKLKISPEYYTGGVDNIGLICTNSNLYNTVLVGDSAEIINIHISNWNLHNIDATIKSADTSSSTEPIFGYTGSNNTFLRYGVKASNYIKDINDNTLYEPM